jgi:hypothetical protein
MSGVGTKHMMLAYLQMAPVAGFFANFFTARRDTIYNSETVEIDIEREGEDIAAVLRDCDTGVVLNSFDQFTNKEFTPPKHGEGYVITAGELQKRMPGDHPFEDVNYQANVSSLALKKSSKVEGKIRRSVNLQAAQVLQTGTVDLPGEDGTSGFTLDFKPKATHFPTAGTAWNAVGADPIADLLALQTVIKADGKTQPNALVFGSNAWEDFISNEKVLERLDNRRYELGNIQMPEGMDGGTFHGTIAIGAYRYQMWTCEETYKDIATGDVTQYMNTNKCIMMNTEARLDAAYGSVPFVVAPEQRASVFMPPRLESLGKGGFAAWPNAYIAENNKSVKGELYTRPLMIPVAIDTFGCITTR